MTQEEFVTSLNKLIETFGQTQFPKSRIAMIYDEVRDLSPEWWASTVRRMVLEFNPRFNIAEAARAEQHAKNSVARTNELCRQVDGSLEKISETGFQKVLAQFGAGSFSEAVFKNKKSS